MYGLEGGKGRMKTAREPPHSFLPLIAVDERIGCACSIGVGMPVEARGGQKGARGHAPNPSNLGQMRKEAVRQRATGTQGLIPFNSR